MTAQPQARPAVASRVDFPTAREVALKYAPPLGTQRVMLGDAAGRVLAQTLVASDDLVNFARSAMDGYAVRAADVRSASRACPVRLPLGLERAYAGSAVRTLLPGTTLHIATGGALPDGADAVVPFEDVQLLPGAIRLLEPVGSRAHVFEAGDDARRGALLADAGATLTPGLCGLLAAGGFAHVLVRRRPRVAIVSTGDELVDVGAQPRLGQIRNSNAVMLAAALARDGAVVTRHVHARDATGALLAALSEAFAGADLVITTGGASAGERDLVKDALRSLGGTFAFESVAMRPAKPTAIGTVDGTLVAVLPGNPAAAYVAYMTLVRGMVRQLGGRSDVEPVTVAALLEAGRVHRKEARHFFMFGRLHFTGGRFRVRPLENQCSSLTRTAADANAVIVVDPGSGFVEVGQEIVVEVTDWDAVAFAHARHD